MQASLKYLRHAIFLTLLVLPACRNSILHKDGAREAITEPIVEAIDKQVDKLHVEDLVDSSNKTISKLGELADQLKSGAELSKETIKEVTKSLESVQELINKVGDTSEASTQLINTANELLVQFKELMPEITKMAQSSNEILPLVKDSVEKLNKTLDLAEKTVESAKNTVEGSTTESIWLKVLPALAIIVVGLLGLLLVIRAVKKGKSK